MSPSNTTGFPLYPASLYGPLGIAVDNRNATSWIGNYFYVAPSATHMINATGADDTNSPYGGMDSPVGVAIDNAGSVWVANSDAYAAGTGYLTKFTGSGTAYTSQNFATGTGTLPGDVAIDSSGNVWVTNYVGVALFNNSGTELSPVGGYPSPQNIYTNPQSVIVDGLNRAWASNIASDGNGNPLNVPGSVTAFSTTGTLISTSTTTTSAGTFLGYTAAGAICQQPNGPQSIKIDPSGNLWITGFNATGTQVITELVGIAAPVVTPLSVASSTQTLGTRP